MSSRSILSSLLNINGLVFRVAYCDLAIKLDSEDKFKHPNALKDMISRWVSSIISGSEFFIDVLADEVKVEYPFESVTYDDIKFSECYLNDNQEEIMRFLSKIYLLDRDTIFQRFVTTLRLLVEL